MNLPRFYIPPGSSSVSGPDTERKEIVLGEENSRHVVQVLRMKQGEQLQLTDGQGCLLTVVILDDHKKKCRVQALSTAYQPASPGKVALGISLLKNANRLEWVLEKVTEIGIQEIIPLICERTEKQHVRQDRLQQILVSAMLQSQQAWLPVLRSPTPLARVIEGAGEGYDRRFIAHCLEEKKVTLAETVSGDPGTLRSIILIGPEGDFSPKEIEMTLQQGFIPVTLGETRLRSETAGIVAATLLRMARPRS